MTKEQIREKLATAHLEENELNRQMSVYDKQIKTALLKKPKLAKRISANMKWRNQLIEKLVAIK